ncbi:MAG TPA: VOC family protein [Micromonosporaceae bacterium]
MHHSRIDGIFIDHPADSFGPAVAFWSAATGRTAASHDPYRPLGIFGGDTVIEVQRLDDATPPRVHLDVATDDINAEVDRLERHGAVRSAQIGDYWQMRDPGGLAFCVIGPHTDDFAETAVRWG